MRNSILILFVFYLVFSCSNDDSDIFGLPEGRYRLVERICFCGPLDEGLIEYWIFNVELNTVTIRILDDKGQLIESSELFYGRKGNNLLIGERAEFILKRAGRLLELTILDDPGIADDELTLKLISD